MTVLRATIEVEYVVDPENLNCHESVTYQERYRILNFLKTEVFKDTQKIDVEVTGTLSL